MTIDYDALRATGALGSGSAPFVKFPTPGTSFTGTLTGIRQHQFDGDDRPSVLADFDTAEGPYTLNMTAFLKRWFGENQPQTGTVLTITFTHYDGPMKAYDVTVGGEAAAPAATPPTAPPSAPPKF